MLAIHDIGETIVGDVVTVARDRTEHEIQEEEKAVQALLNDEQYALYLEYENTTTLTGSFAKSMDKLAGMIMAYANDPYVERERQKYF